MLRALITTGLVLAAQTPSGYAQQAQPAQPPPAADPTPSTRQQAIQAIRALQNSEPAVRRAAVVQLGKVGTMADANLLVARLRDDDAAVRHFAEASLWQVWSRSGERAIDALFLRGIEQMAASQMPEALTTFSEIIRKKPAFAEGWNKRATIYFLLGQYQLSMKDCDEVLKRNPKHFGALSGYGQIYLALGDPDRAQPFLERALKINPGMSGVAAGLRLIEQLREKKRRQTI
jgi:tetratricopeptide (TPR) repeat protein